jgi:hypothetical protein
MTLVRRLFSKPEEAGGDGLQYDYQPDVDLLFAWLGEPQAARNVEVEPGIYVRVIPSGTRVVGIEILDCAGRFGIKANEINKALAEKLLHQYSPKALDLLRD